MNAILTDIKPETARHLAEQAKANGKSVDEYLKSLLPPINGQTDDAKETIGDRLERKGLIGILDSSEPADPTSPPQRSPLYEVIAAKYRKQGLNLP
jgi:hypothetical protein